MCAGEEAQESKHGLLTTIGYQLGPKEAPHYALEGSIAIGGAGVSWLRDQLGLIASAEESEAVAASVPDTAGEQHVAHVQREHTAASSKTAGTVSIQIVSAGYAVF